MIKSDKAQEILCSNKSDDLKLFEIFQIYKDDIRKQYNELYYALLGWKDSHLRELQIEQDVKVACNHDYEFIGTEGSKFSFDQVNIYKCKICGDIKKS